MDNQFRQDIKAAMSLARELLELAEHDYTFSADADCGVFFGIMRDCGYKIRRQAERELRLRKRKARWGDAIDTIQ